jgi:glutathione S-transferase
MKLLISPASPFARKVRVVLRETDQLSGVEEVNVTSTPGAPDAAVIAANPTGKIPTLIRGDGPAIYDSRVICRFFDARAKTSLYPESRLWEVLTLEATADGIMDAAVLMVYETRFRPAEAQSTDWLDAQWSKVDRALTAVDARWMSHLSGPLNMGQIATACALSYLDLRHADRNWRDGRDALAAWHGRFSTRESMTATAPD